MTYLEGAVLRNHWLEVGAAAQDESMRLPFLFATDHCKIGISTALQNAFDMELARTQIMGSIAEVPPQVRVKALFAHRNTCVAFALEDFAAGVPEVASDWLDTSEASGVCEDEDIVKVLSADRASAAQTVPLD